MYRVGTEDETFNLFSVLFDNSGTDSPFAGLDHGALHVDQDMEEEDQDDRHLEKQTLLSAYDGQVIQIWQPIFHAS